MEIERIDDNTLILKIPYVDIEKMGYTKEDILFNREKGEELFRNIVEDIYLRDEFPAGEPLWVQVQTVEKGILVTVTKSTYPYDNVNFEGFVGGEETMHMPIGEKLEDTLRQTDHISKSNKKADNGKVTEADYSSVLRFSDIEDVISLSQQVTWEDVQTTLYQFEDSYFVYFHFENFLFELKEVTLLVCLGLEYGSDTNITIHRLQEYGKCIAEKNAMQVMQEYFPIR